MAQISIINIKDIIKETPDYRFEAEFFLPRYLEQKKIIYKNKTATLRDIVTFINGQSYDSTEFNSIGDIFIAKIGDVTNKRDWQEWDKISKKHFKNKHGLYLKHGDILMTLTGDPPDVGKVHYIYNPPLKKLSWNQRVALIRFQNQDFILGPEVLFIILSTKFSKDYIERYAKGIRQRNVGNEPVKNLKIPLLPQSFQLQIEKIVKEAYEKQSLSKGLYKEAEQILLEELDLKDFKPKHKLTFTTTKKEIEQAKRFDAEYFQPKYEEIIEKIKSYKGGFDKVGEVVNIKDKNFTPKDDVKYKYVALADISNDGYIQSFEEDFGKNLPTRARRIINKGDVIISSVEGSLNSCALIEEEFDNSICSTGFYVVNSERINSETLLVLMKSYPIQKLFKKGCKGTILTAIPKDELEEIILPIIDNKTQEKISQKIKESFKLRKEAKELLEKAKKMVEDEIESNAKN